jgi:hypothetical protein
VKVVFASASAVIGQAMVRMGTHWPADDPLVLANPSFFSEDPKYGLVYTRKPALNEQALVDSEREEPRVKRAYVRHNA